MLPCREAHPCQAVQQPRAAAVTKVHGTGSLLKFHAVATSLHLNLVCNHLSHGLLPHQTGGLHHPSASKTPPSRPLILLPHRTGGPRHPSALKPSPSRPLALTKPAGAAHVAVEGMVARRFASPCPPAATHESVPATDASLAGLQVTRPIHPPWTCHNDRRNKICPKT